jgi:hypothetical protein
MRILGSGSEPILVLLIDIGGVSLPSDPKCSQSFRSR